MLAFEVSQFTHQEIELGIGDLGGVKFVVPAVVVGDLCPKFCDPVCR